MLVENDRLTLLFETEHIIHKPMKKMEKQNCKNYVKITLLLFVYEKDVYLVYGIDGAIKDGRK